jgi:hypothetical protein
MVNKKIAAKKDSEVDNTPENPVRNLLFKVAESSEKKVIIISKPFKTRADDSQLVEFVDTTIRRINEAFDTQEKRNLNQELPRIKRFSLVLIDNNTGERSIPVHLIGGEEDTVQSFRKVHLWAMNESLKVHLSVVYVHLLKYLEREGWDFYKVTDAQWREACSVCNPLFNSDDWSEDDRRRFALRARNSIRKGLERGTYTAKFSRKRTKRTSSPSRQDKKPSVEKGTSNTRRKGLTEAKRVASNRDQRKAEPSRGRKRVSKKTRRALR